MEYRELGRSGMACSAVGLGANNFGGRLADETACLRVVHAALDAGVNLIDTADTYSAGRSEEIVGVALSKRRDDAFIATKLSLANRAQTPLASFIRSSCEESLRRLGTDYIDLYQVHWPVKGVRPLELLEPLNTLVQEGKIRSLGECNYAAWRHAEINAAADVHDMPRLDSAQHNYNILNRAAELELLPFCEETNVGFLPYYPLAAGYLTGKYRAGHIAPAGTRGAEGHREIGLLRSPRNEALLEPLGQFAAAHGHTLLELAFGWLTANHAVTSVIAGAMSEEQIQSNVAAANWKLTADEWLAVTTIVGWDPGNLGPEKESM